MWVLLSARSLSPSARRVRSCACLPFAVCVVHFVGLVHPAPIQRRPAWFSCTRAQFRPRSLCKFLIFGRRLQSRPARPVWVAIAPDWNPPRINSAPRRLDYFRTRPGNRTRDPLPGAPRWSCVYYAVSPISWRSTTGAPTVLVKLSRAARTIPRAAEAVNFFSVHTCPVTVPDSSRTAARVNSSPAAV